MLHTALPRGCPPLHVCHGQAFVFGGLLVDMLRADRSSDKLFLLDPQQDIPLQGCTNAGRCTSLSAPTTACWSEDLAACWALVEALGRWPAVIQGRVANDCTEPN